MSTSVLPADDPVGFYVELVGGIVRPGRRVHYAERSRAPVGLRQVQRIRQPGSAAKLTSLKKKPNAGFRGASRYISRRPAIVSAESCAQAYAKNGLTNVETRCCSRNSLGEASQVNDLLAANGLEARGETAASS